MQGCKKLSVVEIWWFKLHLNRAHTVRFFQSFTVFVHDPNEIWGKSHGTLCDVISHKHIIGKSSAPVVPLAACTSGHTVWLWRKISPPQFHWRLCHCVENDLSNSEYTCHTKTSDFALQKETSWILPKFILGGKIVQFEPDLKQNFSDVLLFECTRTMVAHFIILKLRYP